MKTFKNLWNDFLSDDNIKLAIKDFAKGKKKKNRKDTKKFLKVYENDPQKAINYIRNYACNYKNDKHTPVTIYDGISRKQRTIIVPTYRELIVQHMIVNVLKPMFLRGIYERAYGSIPGRGAHDGKKAIEKWIRNDIKNCKYVVKLDIRKYFESIPHDVIKVKLERELKDEQVREVLFTIIDATDKGLPLGFYTSQWLSMWYLKDFDHFVKEQCYAPHYVRYMDDMVIFGSNKRNLWKTYHVIITELKKLGLELNERSSMFKFVREVNGVKYGRDLDFMGFRFFRNRTILRRSIYMKMCRKANRISKKDRATIYDLKQMLSYLGWIKHSDVYDAYLEYIKPFVNFGDAKRRISNYDKRCLNGTI